MTTAPRRLLDSTHSAAGRQRDLVPLIPANGDVSVRDLLTAGGLRGFTTDDMFPSKDQHAEAGA